jgi:hypothetical protein
VQCGPLGGGGDGPVAVAAVIASRREDHGTPYATACRERRTVRLSGCFTVTTARTCSDDDQPKQPKNYFRVGSGLPILIEGFLPTYGITTGVCWRGIDKLGAR